MTFRNNASQAEREAMLKLDRRNNTMHGRALTELDQLMQGRFSKPTEVVGTEPPIYPAAAAWTQDHLPPEPPLGFDVSAVEPVGEPFEIERSRASAGSSTEHDDKSASATPSGVAECSAGDDVDGRKASPVGASPVSTPRTVWRRPL
jgi:hypothetical protein